MASAGSDNSHQAMTDGNPRTASADAQAAFMESEAAHSEAHAYDVGLRNASIASDLASAYTQVASHAAFVASADLFAAYSDASEATKDAKDARQGARDVSVATKATSVDHGHESFDRALYASALARGHDGAASIDVAAASMDEEAASMESETISTEKSNILKDVETIVSADDQIASRNASLVTQADKQLATYPSEATGESQRDRQEGEQAYQDSYQTARDMGLLSGASLPAYGDMLADNASDYQAYEKLCEDADKVSLQRDRVNVGTASTRLETDQGMSQALLSDIATDQNGIAPALADASQARHDAKIARGKMQDEDNATATGEEQAATQLRQLAAQTLGSYELAKASQNLDFASQATQNNRHDLYNPSALDGDITWDNQHYLVASADALEASADAVGAQGQAKHDDALAQQRDEDAAHSLARSAQTAHHLEDGGNLPAPSAVPSSLPSAAPVSHDNDGVHNQGSHNEGNYNKGNANVGDHNHGDNDVGNRDVGSRNVGDGNHGDDDVGENNHGDLNVGNDDIGSNNVGDHDHGNNNVGDYDYGDNNVGSDDWGNNIQGDHVHEAGFGPDASSTADHTSPFQQQLTVMGLQEPKEMLFAAPETGERLVSTHEQPPARPANTNHSELVVSSHSPHENPHKHGTGAGGNDGIHGNDGSNKGANGLGVILPEHHHGGTHEASSYLAAVTGLEQDVTEDVAKLGAHYGERLEQQEQAHHHHVDTQEVHALEHENVQNAGEVYQHFDEDVALFDPHPLGQAYFGSFQKEFDGIGQDMRHLAKNPQDRQAYDDLSQIHHDHLRHQAAQDSLCFCSGTLIRTATGDKPVEELQVGDVVITARGEERPITWIGFQDRAFAPHIVDERNTPICIKKHAMADNMPYRDLFVSPAHALGLSVASRSLLGKTKLKTFMTRAGSLVNGESIAYTPVKKVRYWHIELPSHDMLIANGIAAESYQDRGERSYFSNGAMTAIYREMREPAATRGDVLPRINRGRHVRAVRACLKERADSLSLQETDYRCAQMDEAL